MVLFLFFLLVVGLSGFFDHISYDLVHILCNLVKSER